jgi:hypothetical protein
VPEGGSVLCEHHVQFKDLGVEIDETIQVVGEYCHVIDTIDQRIGGLLRS